MMSNRWIIITQFKDGKEEAKSLPGFQNDYEFVEYLTPKIRN